jgi:nitrate reductase gamma subunit
MAYAVIITIAVAALLLAVIGGAALVARRAVGAASRGESPFGGWRWYPGQLGWVVLLAAPVAAFLLWRVFPVFLFLPIIVPFFLRWRGRGGRPFTWRSGRRQRPSSNGHHQGDDQTIEGTYRSLDDE